MTDLRSVTALSLLLALGSTACPASHAELRAKHLRELTEHARSGSGRAALALAAEIAGSGSAVGTLAEAQTWAQQASTAGLAEGLALRGRLAEARGERQGAFELWLQVLDATGASEQLRRYAAARVAALVDDVRLTRQHLAALGRSIELRRDRTALMLAEALEQVGLRLRDEAVVKRARAALGVVTSYRRSGVLTGLAALRFRELEPRLGALTNGESGAPAFGPALATPDGTVSFTEDGPGVFAAAIPIPASPRAQLEVEVVGSPSVRAFDDGREVMVNDRLGRLGAERARVALAPGPARQLELHVASHEAAPQLRVMVRPVPNATPETARMNRLLEQLAALELALWSGDRAAAADMIQRWSRDRQAPLVASATLAKAWIDDPALPSTISRSRARRQLELGLSEWPDFAEARDALARLVLAAGDSTRAAAIYQAGHLGEAKLPLALALARDGGQTRTARRLAEKFSQARPTSCRAAEALLDAKWETLRFAPDPILDALPRCLELELRAAELFVQAWKLDKAQPLLEELLARSPPGSFRARVRASLARALLARGDLKGAAGQALNGLAADGVQREALLEVLLSVHRLRDDTTGIAKVKRELATRPHISTMGRLKALDPSLDLGLPLSDGYAIAKEAHAQHADGTHVAKGASVRVLLHERHTRVFPDGSMVHRVHRLIHLLDEGAVEELGEIPVPDEAEILEARTWRPTEDGRLQPVEPEDIIEKSSISLPALEPGAIAEVAWFWVESPAERIAPHWLAPVFSFESERATTRLARYVLRMPPTVKPRIAITGRVPEPRRPAPGVWVFTVENRPRVLPEPLDPRPDRRRAAVRASSQLGVDELRAFYRDTLIPRLRVTAAVRALADKAGLRTAHSPERRLRALHTMLLDQVQPDEEADLFDSSAGWTAASRGGERSVLLVALCAAAGVDCQLALARPKTRGAVEDSGVLDLDDFAYPLVLARLPGGGQIWVDTASRFVPFGYLSPLVQDVPALNLGGGQSLLTTPEMPAREGQRKARVVIDVSSDSRFEVRGDEVLTGFFAMGWRHVLADMDRGARERALAGMVQQSLPGTVVDKIALSGLEERESPLGLSWHATGRLAHANHGTRALTLGLSPEHLSAATVKVARRTAPLFVNRSGNLVFEVQVNLPKGWVFMDAPRPVNITHRLLQHHREVQAAERDHRMTIRKSFRLSVGTVDPARYSRWTRAARLSDRADVIHLVIVPSTE